MAKSKALSANKRTPTQRRLDVALVIQLLMTCHTQEAVTAELNKARKGQYKLSRPQVGDIVKKAIAEIMERNCHNTLEERFLAAQRQLAIAMEALRCHGLSLQESKKVVAETLRDQTDDGKVTKHRKRTETTKSAGDKGYLSVATAALAEYSRLLGLYVQPVKDALPEIPAGNQTNTFMFQVNIGGGPSGNDPHDKIKPLHDRPIEAAEDQAATPAGGGITVKPSSSAVARIQH